MGTYVQYFWPSSRAGRGIIAPLQNLQAQEFFQLNTALPQTPYVFDGLIRSIALFSTTDNSDVQFEITGIGSPVENGNPTQPFSLISEIVDGPNNETIFSQNIYKQVNSVKCLNNMDIGNTVSIGPGNSGITNYFFFDYNRIFGQIGMQFQFFNQTSLTANVFHSLQKPEIPNLKGNLEKYTVPAIPFGEPLEDVTENVADNVFFVTSVIWAQITQEANDEDSLIFTIIQQGIK